MCIPVNHPLQCVRQLCFFRPCRFMEEVVARESGDAWAIWRLLLPHVRARAPALAVGLPATVHWPLRSTLTAS